MIYKNIRRGIFRSRPNRFIAEVEIDGKVEICHVKNTGRCKELLIPNAIVYADYVPHPKRTTNYDLIAVEKGSLLINMDSQAPNHAFGEYLRQGHFLDGIIHVKAEAKYGSSRFDFYVETKSTKAFIEVKGVTLEENGIALFPDAPTQRGIKHLSALADCLQDGYAAYAVFIIQMRGVSHFTPNYKTHPAFGETLARAIDMGVNAVAFDCVVSADSIVVRQPMPIRL